MPIPPPARLPQRGAALMVALVFLVILTLFGITGLQSTTQQERMSGNLRDRDLAFQAAESALRAGERLLQQPTLPEFDGNDGLYDPPLLHGGRAATWNAFDWDQQGRDAPLTGNGDALAAPPAFAIERLGATPTPGGSLASDEALEESELYRITARSTGGSGNATVILQSTYLR